MQFTVYRNVGNKRVPFLLDVQSDLIDGLKTRVVVPLIAASHVQVTASRLMPILEVAGEQWVMDTTLLAGVPRSILGKPVADLSHQRAAIMSALDMLISGI
ncbi:MAG: CcdB family protein [Proteobacteria bacterium]|nr:CcdB family protein [Pseudomonadota bacterium]